MSARTLSAVALLGLVLLSFALRIYRLDGQSLWGDEGWSVYFAGQPSVASVLRNAHDAGDVPPGYYLTLHAWIQAAGQSEFALRYITLFCGVLAVPALFALGRRLGGTGTGVIAALLLALSPFHVYYSQDARMYAQTLFFTLLSTYFFWRLFTENTRKASRPWQMWAGYVTSSTLAVYSHLFAGYIILAQALLWLGDLLWRRRAAWRTALHCLSAQAVTFLLFLPWLVYVWDRVPALSEEAGRVDIPLLAILRHCLSVFSAGVPIITSAPEEVAWPVLVPFLLLLVLALLWPWKRRSLVFMVTCLSVPTLATFLISFPPLPGWIRYFIAASPFYYLLLARGAHGLSRLALPGSLTVRRQVSSQKLGERNRVFSGKPGFSSVKPQFIERIRRQVGQAGLIALLVMPLNFAQVRSLYRYYTDSLYWRWDYRAQMATMAEAVEAGAAIVYSGRDASLILKYYLPADTSYFVVPSVCNENENENEERIRDEIAAIAAGYEQIWLVREMPVDCDRNHRTAQWLKEHAHQVSENWLENTVFDLYLTPARMGTYRSPSQSVSTTFDDQFELSAYALNQEHIAPGGTLAVALRWRVLSPMDVDYKFFLVLLGPNNESLALRDGMPLNWLRPTTSWEVGETVDDRWGMVVGADTPVGTYPLYVGAYDPTTGERLPVQTPGGEIVGDMVLVAEIEVR